MGNAAARAGSLTWRESPADLARFVMSFVHRDEVVDGKVVRVLPELRASIQVMADAQYWRRGPALGAAWRQLPKVSLWAPQHDWGYGFATGRIQAFGVLLTGEAMRLLLGRPVSEVANEILNLGDVNPDLAFCLHPRPAEPFDTWMERVCAGLRAAFVAAPDATDPIQPTLDILATAETSAVGRAAQAAGLSERHYRRLFRELHGVTPKRYQRGLRVDRMLRQLHHRPWEADPHPEHPISFADQPHAIREFRALTGLTPAQYARAKLSGDATLRSVAAPGVAPPAGAG